LDDAGPGILQMTLKQHLRESCAGAKIAVNLERPALVKEVRKSLLTKLKRELAEGEFAVADARPQRHAPGVAPTRTAVAAPFQKHFRGIKNFHIVRRKLRARVEPPQRRHVTMVIVGLINIIEPFLKLAMPSDLIGRELGARLDQLLCEIRIDAQDLRRFDG